MRRIDWAITIVGLFILVLLHSVVKNYAEYERSEDAKLAKEVAKLAEEKLCECRCEIKCVRWTSPEQDEFLSSLCKKL